MSRKIQIYESDIGPEPVDLKEYTSTAPSTDIKPQNDLISYSEILKSVILQYPEKLLFNIRESAKALNVSVEFIRKKISQGQINTVTLGDRKLISVNEIARLIHKGVK